MKLMCSLPVSKTLHISLHALVLRASLDVRVHKYTAAFDDTFMNTTNVGEKLQKKKAVHGQLVLKVR